jgi:hypothetical protein
MKASEVISQINAFLENLVPTEVTVDRKNGGTWDLTEYLTGQSMGSFDEYDELVKFLKEIGAYAIPQDVLNASDIHYNLPVEKIKSDYKMDPNESGVVR